MNKLKNNFPALSVYSVFLFGVPHLHHGLILQLSYPIDGESSYTDLTYTAFTAGYTTEARKTRAGWSYLMKISCKIPKIEEATSDTLGNLIGRKLNIKFKDANENFHYA